MLTRFVALVIALVALWAAAAGAATLDMETTSADDPYQVVPFPDGSTMMLQKQASPGTPQTWTIALPNGSWWGSYADPEQPIVHAPSRNGPVSALPALPSGAVPGTWARDADNNLWFTEVFSTYDTSVHPDKIGWVNAATATAREFGGLSPGARARSITVGPDGNAWFVEYGTNSIGRITPNGVVSEFRLPATVQLVQERGEEMTFGPGNDLYFLVSHGLGRMTLSGIFLGIVNGGLSDFEPNAVVYAKDGNLWTTECSANTATRISPTGVVTRAPAGSFPPGSCPMGITTGFDGIPWLYEWNTGRMGRILFDSPLATTYDATSVRTSAADLNGSASPRGVTTTVHFEYGTTTAYGRSTLAQAIGDGDSASEISAHPTDLQPSTSYHYRLVASSVIGTVYGDDQTVTTRALPPPPPPPLPVDRDGDGYSPPNDCDDLSQAIHPGAVDRPENRIDEDCSGSDAKYERFQPHVGAGWKISHGRIVFTRLTIDAMPAGSSLKLTCTGPGCVSKGYNARMSAAVEHVDMIKRLKKAQLRKGALVELTLSRPGFITTILRWTMGTRPRATILCLPPGASKPSAC
jgi:streptogramin lyase